MLYENRVSVVLISSLKFRVYPGLEDLFLQIDSFMPFLPLFLRSSGRIKNPLSSGVRPFSTVARTSSGRHLEFATSILNYSGGKIQLLDFETGACARLTVSL